MKCLAGFTRPDLLMSAHQEDKFSSNRKFAHDTALNRTGKYMLATSNKILIFNQTQLNDWKFSWTLILMEP